jgi:uncharacterized protein YbjQ (UPF0145 family)
MKKLMLSAICFALTLPIVMTAHASDDAVMLPISAALEAKDAQEKMDDSIKMYFGPQSHPKVLTKLGSDSTNKKTNGFGKTAEKACSWAFLSAVLQLQTRAKELGANAVVNIVSYYKKNEMSSATEFECHKGGLIAGVALKGDFVKIAGK